MSPRLTETGANRLQKNAKHPETFSPHHISLEQHEYASMVKTMRLPYRAIEGTSVVGPFFWASYDHDANDPHLRKTLSLAFFYASFSNNASNCGLSRLTYWLEIIHRKSDVRKKGKTRGWELMLSHSFHTNITTGYVKGTPSSDINDAIDHIKSCAAQVAHPMLLPIIILSHDLSSRSDQKQREARAWLRRLENAVTMRNEIDEKEGYMDFDLDAINRDLVECHSQVLWRRPQAYQEIIKEVHAGMDKYWLMTDHNRPDISALHDSLISRLDFYRIKLTGIEHYVHTTLERLNIQRQALYNIIAQKESKLNLEMAAQQRRLAHASKRDSTAMKTLSLLGALFLPGTFLASLFSMSFFDFNVGPEFPGMDPDDYSGKGAQVSEYLWLYFVVTIPLTLAIVGAWWYLDHRRQKMYAAEDVDIEEGIGRMETEIMAVMRKKTMSKATTWNSGQSPAIQLIKKAES
ncbi:hypothetical protein PG996_002449 [Apiospora saccharicola]|uniref:Uncharacterized protein n=1 Tax=Apiospora saccharicola TaxID=335842 RepID=A0ABR1WJI7_9PEZI